jgi:hypothetical protein
MFGRSKPVVLESYGRRRARWRVPPWLVLLVTGTAIGAAGVVYVQERYLPPRLSADASTRLQAAFMQADSERTRLQAELAQTGKQLESALAEKKSLADELGISRQTAERLRGDVASLVASLPPDPRGGAVQVRAARFSTDAGKLIYDVVLSRERAGSKPLSGVMQLVVAGAPQRGGEASVKLKPVAISVGSVESVRGGVALPDGFDPRQATINVLDRPDGKLLGMRVMLVK